MNSKALVLLMLFYLVPSLASDNTQKDVLFVVVGKTANYRQSANAKHMLLNYHFFAEIFLKKNGSVRNPVLLIPGSATEMPFKGDGSVLEVHGGRYANEEDLNNAFPDGNYIFSYRLSDNTLLNESVQIKNDTAGSRIPDPITIYLSQQGRQVSPSAVDPASDLTVSWSAFASASADPAGIVDDLIFVVTGNCRGEKIDHSGGPFGSGDYLTFAATEYVIPASKLLPGQPLQIFVEQAEMDTSMYRGIPEIATYATTTFLDIHTSGETQKGSKTCPAIMLAMDGGQTDRPSRKQE